MRFLSVARIGIVFLCAGGALLGAQSKPQKPPVFRGGTSLVTVDAYPTRSGKVVEGLTPEDFEIFEDGKRQAVESLEFVPFNGLITDDDRSTYMSAREGLELAADPRYRVTVFVIDRAAFYRESWIEMRDALLDFLRTNVEPRDLIDVITTDQAWQNLSLGRRLGTVEAEIDDPEWLDAEPSESTQVLLGCGNESLGPRIRADATYTMLEGVVRLLGQAREDHSSIVFISDGLSQMPADRSGQNTRTVEMPHRIGLVNGRIQQVPAATDMHTSMCKQEAQRLRDTDFARRFDELTRIARAANVAFYPIAVRSLMEIAAENGRGPLLNYPGSPYDVSSTKPYAGRAPTLTMHGLPRAHDSLTPLAAATGGLAVIRGKDVRDGLRRIADDVGPHYLLRYYTTNTKRDGGIRTITVRLKKDGTEIRARRWYRAPTAADVKSAPADSKTLERIVPVPVANALVPLTRIKPSAQFLAYGALAGPTLTVTIEVPQEAVDAGRWSDGAEIHVMAETAEGETVGLARGRLLPTGRAVVQVPVDAARRPLSAMIHVKSEGEAVTERIAVGTNAATLVGDPLGYRSNRRSLAVPVGAFVFASDDKLALEWPVLQPIDRQEVRLLDRFGEPLKYSIEAKQQDAGSAKRLVANLKFSNLGRGDYVLELTVHKGSAIEKNLLALRVR